MESNKTKKSTQPYPIDYPRESRLSIFMKGYNEDMESDEENTMIGGSMLYNMGQTTETEVDYEEGNHSIPYNKKSKDKIC